MLVPDISEEGQRRHFQSSRVQRATPVTATQHYPTSVASPSVAPPKSTITHSPTHAVTIICGEYTLHEELCSALVTSMTNIGKVSTPWGAYKLVGQIENEHMQRFRKCEVEWPSNPTLRYLPTRNEACSHKALSLNVCSSIVHNVPKLEKPKRLSAGEGISKLWSIYSMEGNRVNS